MKHDQEIVPYSVEKNLPDMVSIKLSEMPEEAQKEFLLEYQRLEKSTLLAYLVYPFHYVYIGKLLTQILFWFTGGGFGIWALINLFRLPFIVKRENEQIAYKVIRKVLRKFKLDRSFGDEKNLFANTSDRKDREMFLAAPPVKRKLDTKADPIHLSVFSLKAGYMVDYGLKTWTVKSEQQYDWTSGTSELRFVMNAGIEEANLYVRKDHDAVHVYMAKPVSLFMIDDQLDDYILQHNSAPKTLNLADLVFYRENALKGVAFSNSTSNQKPVPVQAWVYYNSNRDKVLRIEKIGHNFFRACLGSFVDEEGFSDILMVQK